MARVRRWPVTVAAIVLAWIAAVLVWAMLPKHETVRVGYDETGATVLVTIECASVFDDPALPGPPPTLAADQAYPRPPCEDTHRDNRLAVGIDLVLAVALLGFCAWGARRSHADGDSQPDRSEGGVGASATI